MFIGEYSYSVDNKGRIAIPSKFRSQLADGCVVTRGLDNCLFIYPKQAWEKLAQKLADLPLTQADARAFVRLMLAGAMDLSLDRAGRVILPTYLRDFAKITKQVVVTGLYNRLELWNAEDWNQYKSRAEENSSDIAEKLIDLGI